MKETQFISIYVKSFEAMSKFPPFSFAVSCSPASSISDCLTVKVEQEKNHRKYIKGCVQQ